MPTLIYRRCPQDDVIPVHTAIGVNPDNGEPIELNSGGMASVVAVQSAMLTLSTSMKNGTETDFLEKVALSVLGTLADDPHSLCPLFSVCSFCLLMLKERAGITFDDEGNVVIASEDGGSVAKHDCALSLMDDEEDDDESDETPLGGDGVPPNGNGDRAGGEGDS